MTRWECLSCGGTYDDVLQDGMAYFHACPASRINPAGNKVPIPNRRDENLVMGEMRAVKGKPGLREQKTRIKREGAGRRPA